MFSPYYARARRKGRGVPQNHVAMNVALYGKRARAWTMTERGAAALRQSETALQIGPSSMHWDGTALHIEIEEVAFPFIRRVKGSVRVTPVCLPGSEFRLDSAGTQIWQPIAPIAHIEVNMTSPSLSWSGTAYFDHNRGTQPLESSFHRWDWSRQATPNSTRILYDMTEVDGTGCPLALDVARHGRITQLQLPQPAALPRGPVWRVARGTRCDAGSSAHVAETLEDTPFYARSLVAAPLWGDGTPSMHESLDLNRFKTGIVQAMLPFRMPRRAF